MDRVKCSHYRYVLIIVCNAQNSLPRERSLYYGVVQKERLDCFYHFDLSFLIHIQLRFHGFVNSVAEVSLAIALIRR